MHFPGIVEYASTPEPAYTFEHYIVAGDLPDRLCRQFHNKGMQVVMELWVRLSSHYIAQYITFFGPSLNNDWLHRVYM
jgi:hypothetical protein